eukprot:TRINITY_DN18791_c0_g1_i2.p1 TRINITY_DN18791_c0_g1~~TRINITY_DN18791_c0_g1_i2.p1  ORF type:complete len:597 (+),score=133.96 TRINITY_DN18791_c0_g1_i2:51-1793(+)
MAKAGKAANKGQGTKKVFKMGKKVLKDRKADFLKKKLKQQTKRKELNQKVDVQGGSDTIKVAWKGRQKEVDKKELQGDKKGRELLKKIAQKRVLNADEKHRLKMLGETGDLMHLWEVLREKSKSKEEKQKAISQIMEFTKDTFLDDVRRPDMSRIFQAVLKWGGPTTAEEVIARTKGHIADLCLSKHSNQFVKSLIEYSAQSQKPQLLSELKKAGHKIITHKNALVVLEHFYNKLNAENQNQLILSFFDGIDMVNYEGYPKLNEILKNIKPSSLEYKMIIERLFRIVSPSVTKGSFDNIVMHRLLETLLLYGTEFEIQDFLEDIHEGVVNICRTKPGALAATMILEHASKRIRRNIVKSFQNSVADMCCAKSTSLFIAKVFDIVDDTESIIKVIGKEIMEAATDLLSDPQGTLPLLHLLTPDPERKKKYFTFNHFDSLWKVGDDPFHIEALNKSYVKEKKKICSGNPKDKHAAILSAIVPTLVTVFMADLEGMVQNPYSRRVITELLHYVKTTRSIKLNKTATTALSEALEARNAAAAAKVKRSNNDESNPSTKRSKPETEKPAVAKKPAKKVVKKKKKQ